MGRGRDKHLRNRDENISAMQWEAGMLELFTPGGIQIIKALLAFLCAGDLARFKRATFLCVGADLCLTKQSLSV